MQQLFDVWNRLTFNRKIIAIAATMGVFFAVMAMARMVSAPSLSLMYAGLESSAAGEVVRALEARGVAHEVRGGAIFVDASQRDQLRMTLASEGLPANGTGGYELLDNLSGFGTTSQMFDAAYWRAKEGELARTIVASKFINSARVHIANTASNPFQRGLTPTASVSVSASGGQITAQQAKSLKYLVSSAVAGLSPDDVAVIGADGTLLGADEQSQGDLTEDRANRIKEKVERLLEARVGVGNAVVEVSIDTVTEREAIRERRFDPQNRVAISTDTEEITNSSTQAGSGAVSVASNLPDGDAGGGDESSSQNNQTRERVNYEVSETEREIVRAPGAIKRMTVAVLVNGSETTAEDGTVTVEPRADDELSALQELVESAVGFDEARGDVITIKSMALLAVEPVGTQFQQSYFDTLSIDLMSIIQMAVLGIVTLLLGMFVIRPVLAASAAAPAALPPADDDAAQDEFSGLDLPALDGEIGNAADPLPDLPATGDFGQEDDILPELPMLGGMGMGMGMGESSPADRLRNLIDERQTETVEILRNWLEEKEDAA